MATTDEVYLAEEVKQEIVRLLPNLIDEIAIMRATISSGGTLNPEALNAGARGMLGRLRRLYQFYQAEPAILLNALSVLNIPQAHFASRVTGLRDALRVFRDAQKTTVSEITDSINVLESSIPAQKRFLNQSLPSDW